ncbi:MAG TPA: cytidylate kinase-like family protein [Terriglobia bacterium]|nr:cytidylate kinase-like family protein [Terriglobia bacterium]
MSATHHPLSLEKLIERQIRFWELRRQQGPEKERRGRGRYGTVCFGPYLLISREKGSGGRTVAAMVAERLKWQVFDREIVDEIARRAKIRQQLIESLDERGRGGLEEFIRDFLGHEAIAPGDYLYHLKQVLLTLGHQGDVVIVGRGAEHVLPSQFGLRAWMVAPLDLRIERVCKVQGVTVEAARSQIEQVDKEREKFVRTHFQHSARNPLDYDLVINTASLTAESTAEILLSALQEKLGISLSNTRAA